MTRARPGATEHATNASNHIIKARNYLAAADATGSIERKYTALLNAANEHERAARELRNTAHEISRAMSSD